MHVIGLGKIILWWYWQRNQQRSFFFAVLVPYHRIPQGIKIFNKVTAMFNTSTKIYSFLREFDKMIIEGCYLTIKKPHILEIDESACFFITNEYFEAQAHCPICGHPLVLKYPVSSTTDAWKRGCEGGGHILMVVIAVYQRSVLGIF